MSFILEALKKSEAERRQGEVPSLQNEIGSATPRRRSIWPLVLTFALLLNGAVLGGWLLLRQEKAPIAANSSGELDRILASRAARPERAADMPASKPAETKPAAAVVKPVSDPAVPPAQSAAPAGAESAPKKTETAARQEKPKAPASAETETRAADPEPLRKTETAQTAQTAKPEQPVRPAKSLQPAKPVAAAAKATVAAPASAETFPLLSELPPDVRSGLPVLNVQLHFFSPDPARRLVRLNGFNLREGDRGADGLSVVEITPDGTRLSCRGVRFFLPTTRR